jgi:hypothetical protein
VVALAVTTLAVLLLEHQETLEHFPLLKVLRAATVSLVRAEAVAVQALLGLMVLAATVAQVALVFFHLYLAHQQHMVVVVVVRVTALVVLAVQVAVVRALQGMRHQPHLGQSILVVAVAVQETAVTPRTLCLALVGRVL